jgi:carbamoyl-phosphate synthase large subunit
MNSQKVMIAGIGGASLGTEICKALQLAGGYEIYGCDISPTAYGLYDPGFTATYRVNRDHYVGSVIDACSDAKATWLIPGGEEPMVLLRQAQEDLFNTGITLTANAGEVADLCSDKEATFRRLKEIGIPAPRTAAVATAQDIDDVGLPCIVKPSTGSGGSVAVFFAVSTEEAMMYAEFIKRCGSLPIAQEYLDIQEGEFTIGVLSLPDARIVSSVALRRSLDAKLSVAYRGRGGIISSGYSQGYIGEFPDLCRQAETIAQALGSRGPINIQGRVRDGVLYPFEINPRFSASTYLRALAGINEVDMFIRCHSLKEQPKTPAVRPGWYLRSLAEHYVPEGQLK